MKSKELKILLVEPSKSSAELERLMLLEVPMVSQVVALPNPVAALNILHTEQMGQDFSMIVTCAHAPRLSGFELIDNLAKRDLLSIPVIMISTDSSLRQKALEYGALDFLEKPIDFELLKESISRAASMIF